ncbi:glycosyltransferase family 2 protein [Actinomadura graeca]|uniref:Glycosyltransferase family 2 protein n=1 Tax=Actinomadura graeca TaxID=2750812 RepID=A0ABX8R099_9ACTN|nr:glycosyltransferase family A protein [Actinomadura graeca]QXJ24494.1 glycosyltransferase family 2 protein [Actinomadura graeca]
MSPETTGPRIAVVITTTGRPRLLDRLLLSLAGQTLPPHEVVVVDQGTGPGAAAVVERRSDRLAIRRVASPGGASAGRNAGLTALGLLPEPSARPARTALAAARPRGPRADGPAPAAVLSPPAGIVAFPDDDTWYPPDALARAARALAGGPDVVSGRLLASDGDRAQWRYADEPCPIDARTVWSHARTETCFFRADLLRTTGGFDEDLGVGCGTPWQSGAETDLLLRALKTGRTLTYDPGIRVYEHNPDEPDTSDPVHRARARHAARGAGRVYRRHYGVLTCTRVVARPIGDALLSAARGRVPDARRHLHKAVGRFEGMTGLLLKAPASPRREEPM